MTGFFGSVLFVFGSLFAYMALVRDAWAIVAASGACVALGLWMCRRSGVF